jgi:hypothetical protein
VSTDDASASASTSLLVDGVATENVTAATSIASTEHESIQSVGKMIQELFHPDNA